MNEKHQVRTAILVDGGFYRKRATSLFGKKSPVERAEELSQYCYAHLRDKYESRYLYRIFYYDCPPVDKNAFHPLLQKNINLGKRPAAKQARREGIDFILDPMGATIKDDLYEHIDGIRSQYKNFIPKESADMISP